jgi:hypothetical protein
MGDEGLEHQAQTVGVTDESPAGGAHVVQSSKLQPRWKQIRGLIADCSDLLPEARQSIIAQGDEAASLASKPARRDSLQG